MFRVFPQDHFLLWLKRPPNKQLSICSARDTGKASSAIAIASCSK